MKMNVVKNFVVKNASAILTIGGCAGVIFSVGSTATCTIKACKIVDEMENPTKKEIIKKTWKYYIPPLVTMGLSIACIVGSNRVNAKNLASMAALYSMNEKKMKEYKDAVKATLSDKKVVEVQDNLAKSNLEKAPSNTSIFDTGNGETLFYDSISGRFFKSDIEQIRRIQNDLNSRIISGEFSITLNELYFAIGLESIKYGDEMGWFGDELLEIKFSAQIANDNQPCIVIDYDLKNIATDARYF